MSERTDVRPWHIRIKNYKRNEWSILREFKRIQGGMLTEWASERLRSSSFHSPSSSLMRRRNVS